MSTTAGQISEASYVKAKGKEYGTSAGGLMCTGPYEFVKWTPGQSIVMKANPSYWNASQAAKVKTLTFDFVTDPNTLTNALKSGQIDGTYEVPVGSVSTLKSSGAGTLQLARSVAMEILTFTQKSGPIRNADVRKALTIAIDRPEIAKSRLRGCRRACLVDQHALAVELRPEHLQSKTYADAARRARRALAGEVARQRRRRGGQGRR